MIDTFRNLEPKHFKDHELIELTLVQIEKDFDSIELNLRAVEKGVDYFSDLVTDLSYTVESLMTSHPEKLMNVLYRIDLPENLISQTFSNPSPTKKISELILKRELQKVVLRKLYS